ncbi:hypothetical protein [Crenobacter caeni]|uniref:Uncharacterized protein n=1 Tax=Crenobacter caeni TaxID=2705474 RepID=A0A6B2KSC2_9NEIS|nr:hypothetical protein [Crenobacter caeni]NDV12990.1 hypothetical protein [Crenobacter caeni]
MKKGGIIAFIIFIIIGITALTITPKNALFLFLGVYIGSFIFFVRYLLARGLRGKILKGLGKAFLIGLLAMIPVIGWIIIIFFLLKNIVEILQCCREMMPQAIASIIMATLLITRFIFDISHPTILAGIGIVYAIFAYHQCIKMKTATIEDALFCVSTFWLAPMVITMLLMFIVAGLRNLFQSVTTTITKTISTPQLVSAHMRGNVEISPYLRSSSKTVSEVVTKVVPGSGIVTSSVARDASILHVENTKDKS